MLLTHRPAIRPPAAAQTCEPAIAADTAAAVRPLRGWMALLLAYPLLVLIGAITHRQAWSVAALLLVFTLLLGPALAQRRPLAWLAWLLGLGGATWLALHGLAGAFLDIVPALINAALAWCFARTLAPGRWPLVARVIAVVEGEARLALPGVSAYARQLTMFWAVLLAAQALAVGLVLALAVPGGLLATLGVTTPWALPGRWALAYGHFGNYALIALAFVAEYFFRRWHLAHLAHPRLRDLALRVVARWPQLVRSLGPGW